MNSDCGTAKTASRKMPDFNIGNLAFEGYLDHENEMEIAYEAGMTCYHRLYINKAQAVELIRHLATVFEIEKGDL